MGACRNEGLVAGEHVPERLGELSGEVDLGDLGAALAAEALFGALVALGVDRVVARRARCGSASRRPAQICSAEMAQPIAPELVLCLPPRLRPEPGDLHRAIRRSPDAPGEGRAGGAP